MHRNRTLSLVAALIFTLAVTLTGRAQTRSAEQSSQSEVKQRFAAAVERASAPTEQHKALNALVGDFDETVEVHLGPGEPMRVHGSSKGQWIMGGRFVKLEGTADADEQLKGDRLVIYGYDPAATKYTLWQVESSSLSSTSATGDYDAATKTFTFDGTRSGPGGAPLAFRWVLKVADDGSMAQTIF
jgi:hypothetical protein